MRVWVCRAMCMQKPGKMLFCCCCSLLDCLETVSLTLSGSSYLFGWASRPGGLRPCLRPTVLECVVHTHAWLVMCVLEVKTQVFLVFAELSTQPLIWVFREIKVASSQLATCHGSFVRPLKEQVLIIFVVAKDIEQFSLHSWWHALWSTQCSGLTLSYESRLLMLAL